MSFYCENCEERGEAAEAEVERLRGLLREAVQYVGGLAYDDELADRIDAALGAGEAAKQIIDPERQPVPRCPSCRHILRPSLTGMLTCDICTMSFSPPPPVDALEQAKAWRKEADALAGEKPAVWTEEMIADVHHKADELLAKMRPGKVADSDEEQP